MVLNDDQFEILEHRLRSASLRQPGLYHDLLDHFYCLTTLYMDKGMSFTDALKQAENELAPDGFSSIDQEVSFFLHFNFQVRMNRLLYAGAFVAAFGQTMYVTFRTLHWPGGPAFLMVGVFALFLMVIPAMLIHFQSNLPQLSASVRLRILSGLAGIGLFELGSAFKLMHWPGANIQILLGTMLLALVFFPLYFWQMYKKATFRQEMA